MSWLKNLSIALKALFRSGQTEKDIDDEMRFHLDRKIEANRKAGMSAKEARKAAQIAFGSVEKFKEECRDAWGLRFIRDLRRDLLFAFVAARLLENQLYRVSPLDPMAFLLATMLFSIIALSAGSFPALAASRIQPVDALRCN